MYGGQPRARRGHLVIALLFSLLARVQDARKKDARPAQQNVRRSSGSVRGEERIRDKELVSGIDGCLICIRKAMAISNWLKTRLRRRLLCHSACSIIALSFSADHAHQGIHDSLEFAVINQSTGVE